MLAASTNVVAVRVAVVKVKITTWRWPNEESHLRRRRLRRVAEATTLRCGSGDAQSLTRQTVGQANLARLFCFVLLLQVMLQVTALVAAAAVVVVVVVVILLQRNLNSELQRKEKRNFPLGAHFTSSTQHQTKARHLRLLLIRLATASENFIISSANAMQCTAEVLVVKVYSQASRYLSADSDSAVAG